MSTVEFTETDLEIGATPHALSRDVVRAITPHETARTLAAQVARRHGIEPSELLSRSRLAHVVRAREDLARALRAQGWSYPAIGRSLERDHTTVMWLVKGRPRKTGLLVLAHGAA